MVSVLSTLQARLTVPRIIGLAAVLAVALTAFAGASLVAAQRGEPGNPPMPESFQGCVNNHTGVLRIIGAGQQCAAHETPIMLDSGAGSDDLLARIEALEQQNSDQQGEIDALEQQVSDQQGEIDTLEQQISDQQGEIDTLEQQHSDQQGEIDTLEQQHSDQQDEIDALELRVDALETNPLTLPGCLTTEAVDGQTNDDIVFNGCNVHVRNGSGDTYGSVNGLGNLIIGYDEDNGGNIKTGTHNLVVGGEHTYSGAGGFVAGLNNAITSNFSSVSGGTGNTASGLASSVSGGWDNIASGNYSSVAGGEDNIASGTAGSVTGGFLNEATGPHSSVSGGNDNEATAEASSVSGGQHNVAGNYYASVSGGLSNTANGNYSSISGGASETVSGDYDWRAGDLYFTEE